MTNEFFRMKKTRKKKNTVSRKSRISYLEISKTYHDEFIRVATAMMKMAGIDPSEFDLLTKRTKQQLMMVKHTPYRVFSSKEHKVPQSYIRGLNSVMSYFEKNSFYGNPEFKVSFLDYVTYGLTFFFSVNNHEKKDKIPEAQHEILKKIKEALSAYDQANEKDHFLYRTNQIMRGMLMYISAPNYRYYSSVENGEPDYSKLRISNTIVVSSIEPEKRYFTVNAERRASFQLYHYNLFSESCDPVPQKTELFKVLLDEPDIDKAIIKIKEEKLTTQLPVFIQNHALHRIRQRLDCVDNVYINTVISLSFTIPQLITATNGQKMIKAVNILGNTVGYFPYVVLDNALLILSFLPLSSPITPEGSMLNKILGIQLEDSKYIGLDKLSFYTQTDFETIPKLKLTLEKAGMWHLTEIETIEKSDRKEDVILKKFFERSLFNSTFTSNNQPFFASD